MRTLKSTIVALSSAALLALASSAAFAQDDGPAALSIGYVEPPIEMGFDEATGQERAVFETVSEDPRGTGVLTLASALGFLGEDDQTFTVLREAARLETDDGAWSGTITTHLHFDPAGDDGPVGTTFWEMVGEDGYDGLSMFLSKTAAGDASGIIVPTDAVPAQPGPITE